MRDMMGLMKQAQQMQQKMADMQAELETIEVEIAEVSASDAIPALFAEITPDGRRHEDRQAIDLFGNDPRLPPVSPHRAQELWRRTVG